MMHTTRAKDDIISELSCLVKYLFTFISECTCAVELVTLPEYQLRKLGTDEFAIVLTNIHPYTRRLLPSNTRTIYQIGKESQNRANHSCASLARNYNGDNR